MSSSSSTPVLSGKADQGRDEPPTMPSVPIPEFELLKSWHPDSSGVNPLCRVRGWAAWARAVQLADKTFVTTTALVWLGGHFGVTAEQAGIYSWRSKDSYNWEFAGRGATLPEFPGWDEMTGEPVDLVGTCEGA